MSDTQAGPVAMADLSPQAAAEHALHALGDPDTSAPGPGPDLDPTFDPSSPKYLYAEFDRLLPLGTAVLHARAHYDKYPLGADGEPDMSGFTLNQPYAAMRDALVRYCTQTINRRPRFAHLPDTTRPMDPMEAHLGYLVALRRISLQAPVGSDDYMDAARSALALRCARLVAHAERTLAAARAAATATCAVGGCRSWQCPVHGSRSFAADKAAEALMGAAALALAGPRTLRFGRLTFPGNVPLPRVVPDEILLAHGVRRGRPVAGPPGSAHANAESAAVATLILCERDLSPADE